MKRYWVLMVGMLAGSVLLASCGKQAEKPKPANKGVAPKADLSKSILAATDRACAFLAKIQHDDGGWFRDKSGIGVSGLVVEALVGAPADVRKKYAAVIDKGAQYIVSHQRKDGAVVNKDGLLANYRTSVSVRALIAVDPKKYADVISAAVAYEKGIQGTDPKNKGTYGGFGYGASHLEEGEDNPVADTISTGEALEMLAKAGVKKDDEVWKRALVFLARAQNLDEAGDDLVAEAIKTTNDGGAVYHADRSDLKDGSKAGTIKLPDGTEVLRSYGGATYNLLKSLLFAGMPKDNPRVQAAYKWICDHYSVTEHPELGKQGLFYFYYTMARTLELWGSPTITSHGVDRAWARDLAEEILALQKDDGSWFNEKSDRWWEGDPALASAYALSALNICRTMLAK